MDHYIKFVFNDIWESGLFSIVIHVANAKVLEATSQCWSDGKEEAIPLEIRLIVQRVKAPHGQSLARQIVSEPCSILGNRCVDA